MAERLGEALLELGTDDRKLKRGLSGAEKLTRKTISRIKTVFATLVTAAAISGLVLATTKAVDGLDRIAKTADKLGLTVEALQEMRFAAELSGVAIQTFDMAFQRFTRRAGEAAKGTGEAKDALEQLGFTLDDLRTRSPDELFEQAAIALAGTEKAAERLRLAFKLFDSEGVAIVNMVSNLEELREEARRLGIVFDDSLVRRAVQIKDELTRASRVIGADMTRALLKLAPHLVKAKELLVFFVKEIGNVTAAWRELLGLAPLEFPLIAVQQEIDEILDQINRLDGMIDSLAISRTLFKEGQKGEVDKSLIAGINEQLAADILERGKLADKLEVLQDRLFLLRFPKDPPRDPTTTPDDTSEADKRADAIKSISDALERETKMLDAQRVALGKNSEEATRHIALQAALIDLRLQDIDLLPKERAQLEQWTESLASSAQQLEDLVQAHRDAAEAARDHDRRIEDLSDSFADAVLSVRDMESALAAFQSVLTRFLSQMASSGLSSLFTQLGASVVSAFTGGSGFQPPTGAPLSAGPRVHGGPVQAGRAFIVGERRPELFVPKTSGTIFPSVPGGSGVEVNIFAPPGSTVEEERTQVGDMERINILIDNATARNMRPGTLTARALRTVYGQRQTLIAR